MSEVGEGGWVCKIRALATVYPHMDRRSTWSLFLVVQGLYFSYLGRLLKQLQSGAENHLHKSSGHFIAILTFVSFLKSLVRMGIDQDVMHSVVHRVLTVQRHGRCIDEGQLVLFRHFPIIVVDRIETDILKTGAS